MRSILSCSGIQPQVCHNATIRQTFAGSSCKSKQTATTPGRVSMYYEPSKSDRMSIFDKWTAYKSRHLSKTDSSETTGTKTAETQSEKDTGEEFEKDKSALKSILSEAGLQPMTDRKAEARQTFAGIASEFKQSGIPIPRNSSVRQTITGSSAKKSQNVGNNKNAAVRNSLADAKVKQNTTPTTAPNSAARLASIGSATRVNLSTTPLSHQNPVSRHKCEASARRVVCPQLAAASPAPQRQETPSASIQKHRKGVTWADELNSPRRIIKKVS
ncbi:hypothetical protein KUTeg_008671 [Tegillarca granosa]|uniref:Uncharacterized protein n=1 Tax=Tegillarca granosa TaxID=220873 RepID=A0ABQ9FCV3_TEGGR|nr:hypothetical protein KUTeg_008671 [Tegillarca granosa]